MAYTKTKWENRIVEFPNRYKDQNNNVITLIQEPGTITKEGTSVTADVMNNIENGIYNNQKFAYTATLTLANWTLNSTTSKYEYNVTNANITVNHYVEVIFDIENQEKFSDKIGIESYNGGFKIISNDLPESDVAMTVIYQLTSSEVQNAG